MSAISLAENSIPSCRLQFPVSRASWRSATRSSSTRPQESLDPRVKIFAVDFLIVQERLYCRTVETSGPT